MTDPKDALLAEAERLLRPDSWERCCNEFFPCQSCAWLARYEAERAGRGASPTCGQCGLPFSERACGPTHAIRAREEHKKARTAPATPGKEDGE